MASQQLIEAPTCTCKRRPCGETAYAFCPARSVCDDVYPLYSKPLREARSCNKLGTIHAVSLHALLVFQTWMISADTVPVLRTVCKRRAPIAASNVLTHQVLKFDFDLVGKDEHLQKLFVVLAGAALYSI